VLEAVTRALTRAGCVAADEEAVELVAAAPDTGTLEALVARRTAGEPLAWLVGTTRFCDIDVFVDAGVYVPRWQSEALALRAADLLPPDGTAVDLATGSGALAAVLRARHPGARILATDIDPGAVACARRNGVDARLGSLDDPLPEDLVDSVDVLCGVLPYVPSDALHLLPRDVVDWEPAAALDGGTDGLGLVAEAVGRSTRWVRPGGWLLLEVGSDQIDPVASGFSASGYEVVDVLVDGDGDPRGVLGRRSAQVAVGPQASSR
jgi:release factor glutamine methyltransferase